MEKNTLRVEAIIENLEKVRQAFVDLLESNDVNISDIMRFEIVLEELFVNVCNYAYKDKGLVECSILIDKNKIELSLKDCGKPFDPFKKEDPDIHAPIEERPIGGLGIFMVKKNTDEYDYQYENGMNIVHLEFDLKK